MFEKIPKNLINSLNSFFVENKLPIVSELELENNPFMNIVIYKKNNEIIGYLNYSVMYDKAELNYIYVCEKYRQKGIGEKMIQYLLSECHFCHNITLEVKKINMPAINLYKKYGFKECAVRKNYYQGIDGILMIYERGE